MKVFSSFQGTPQAMEYLMDSKLEVDQELKLSCSDFIDLMAKQLLEQLHDFLSKVFPSGTDICV